MALDGAEDMQAKSSDISSEAEWHTEFTSLPADLQLTAKVPLIRGRSEVLATEELREYAIPLVVSSRSLSQPHCRGRQICCSSWPERLRGKPCCRIVPG
jgi:hypothetical protein